MIRFDRLTKQYGKSFAVRNLSFHVTPGEIYALLGPNGAGKTTALRCLAGLLEPTWGTASVDGADVRERTADVRRRLGFLGASMGLYERLTPVEVLEYFGALHGLAGAPLRGRVEELVHLFGIEPFARRTCGRLSTGQRQRVAVARAVVQDPPAVVLDEPTLGLDILSGETLYHFMHQERDKGKAILFSTHNLGEVELLADRIGIMSAGRLVAEGTLPELLERAAAPNLTQAFLYLIEVA
ncbi:MAG TPA: ATP-binding cassette domain-containing protein [Longimicrobiales bacterium]|nr:ATP-binding cassette domain-containing protein [Longimicrobiales bacterium]